MADLNERKGTEKHYAKKRAIRLFAFAAGIISAVLFSVALVRDFVPEKQIFAVGTGLFEAVLYGTVIVSVASIAFCMIAIPKEKKDPDSHLADAPSKYDFFEYYKTDKPAVKFFRFACAAILLAQGVVRLYLFFTGALFVSSNAVITTASVILIFPLCLYFVPEIAVLTASGYKKAHLIYGTVGLFWFITMILHLYYDGTVVLSSPYRLMNQLVFIALLLAVTEEIRLHTSMPSPRAWLGTLCAGFITSFGFNIGRIAMLISGKAVSADDTVYIFAGLAFSLYLGARLFFYDEY